MTLPNDILNIFTHGEQLKLNDVLGKLIAILGIRGSGKTNTSAVIVEELLRKNIPLSIIDTDGEYWSLKEFSNIFLVGTSELADLNIDIALKEKLAKDIAEVTYKYKIPVIIDISDYHPAEVIPFLRDYLNSLWNLAIRIRTPYFIVIEEAHEFIPQRILDYHKKITYTITRIALRGRKRGFGLILVSQRSAKVSKDVLTQAELLFLHKVIHPADLNVYKELLPLSPSEVKEKVTKLQVGEVLFYYNGAVRKRKVRQRRSYHPGYTPTELTGILKNKASDLSDLVKEILSNARKATSIVHGHKHKAYEEKRNRILELLIINNTNNRETIKELNENQCKKISSISSKVTDISLDSNKENQICLAIEEIKLIGLILKNINKYPLSVFLYLHALIEEYPNALSSQDIARKIGRKTVNTRILNRLTKKHILQKIKRGRKTYYKFIVDNDKINIINIKRFYSELIKVIKNI